jgi:hypothetical protein
VNKRTGRQKAISAGEWVNLWPMFATNQATGPDNEYDDVKVIEAISSDTPHAKLNADCTAWLKEQRITGINRKKSAFYEDARHSLSDKLTLAIFNAAYLVVFARGRGRPKGNKAKS